MPTIEDEPVDLGSTSGLIQNLGPGKLYVGGEDVTPETGIEVGVGQAVTVGVMNHSIFAVSDGDDDCDVRVLERGTGLFSVQAPAAEPE